MADNVVSFKGHDSILKFIEKVRSPEIFFDLDFQSVTRGSLSELVRKTPRSKGGGHVARAWTQPKRLGPSSYIIENSVVTPDRKHYLVEILDKGRGEVTPKNSKMLYIPTSNTGATKGLGRPIPKSFVYGRDYVFSKRSKAVRGKKFIDEIVKKYSELLIQKMLKRIDLAIDGK